MWDYNSTEDWIIEKDNIMNLPINNPINLIRLAKFLVKTTDRILNPNFVPEMPIPQELLEAK